MIATCKSLKAACSSGPRRCGSDTAAAAFFVQEGAGHEGDFHGRGRQGGDQHRVRFSNDGNDDWRHARIAPAIGYHHRDQFNHTNSSSDDDQFDCAASAIVIAHHVGNKLHSQTVVVDSGATRHMFYDLSVFYKLESIAPTTVKLGDDSTANCTQIGKVVLHMSDGRRLRIYQVLFYVPRLAIILLSVSQLARKVIMTSFTKTGCALIDSDDGNCLLTEESITPGGHYVITKAVCRASLAALPLSLCYCCIIDFEESSAALQGYADALARSPWPRWF
jgi:hypothetical protein